MKKISLIFMTLIIGLCILTACGGEEQQSGNNVTPDVCEHTGGTATCGSPAICTLCKSAYGDTDPENHELYGAWIAADGYHYRNCKNGCDTSLLKEKCDITPTCASFGNCKICGVMGEELDPDNHTISTEWTTDNGYHFHACLNGCDVQLDKASCDSEGTCTNPEPCNVCGVDYVKKENHTISTEWTVEGGRHFHTCLNGCGFKFDVGVCDITPTCTGVGQCSTCLTLGTATNPDAHAPAAEWTVADGSHYKVCLNGCGTKLEFGACDITPTCKDGGECPVCGTKGTAADPSKHVYPTTYTATDTVHYKECMNGCGTRVNEGTHKYEWVNTTLSTTTERGRIENTCKECSHIVESMDSPATVMAVKGGATGITVLIHDDGTWDTVQIADELYSKYGLVGDVAMQLNGGRVVDSKDRYNLDDDVLKPDSIAKWNTLFATNRWKLISHSMTHKWWGTYDIEKNSEGKITSCTNLVEDMDLMEYEIIKSQALLRQYFPSQRVLTFAHPGFSEPKNYIPGVTTAQGKYEAVFGEAARELIDKYYIAGRGGLGINVDVYDSEGQWETNSKSASYSKLAYSDVWNYFPAYSLDDNVTNAINAINSAAKNGEIAVFYIHKLTTNEANKNDSNTMYSGNYEQVLNVIAGHVNSGAIWHTFYEDAILYLQEAQTAKLATRLGTNGEIYLTLTDGVSKFILDEDGNETDEQIYTYPLTVRVNVPESWKAIKYVQDGRVGYAEAKLVDGKWVADAEIVPDAGEATVTEAALSDIPAPEVQKPVLGTESINYINTEGGTIVKPLSTYNSSTKALNFDAGNSITAKRADVQFDICINSATVGANGAAAPAETTSGRLFLIKFGPAWTSTPYMAEIYATGDGGYYFSDIISTAGGTRNTSFSSYRCEYGKTYTVSVVIDNIATESFIVTWKITDTDGNTHVIGTSTNFANENRDLTTSTQATVSCLTFTAQKRSVLEATITNISIKAYK